MVILVLDTGRKRSHSSVYYFCLTGENCFMAVMQSLSYSNIKVTSEQEVRGHFSNRDTAVKTLDV